MTPISEKYRDVLIELVKNSAQSQTINEHNVYQPGNMKNRPFVEKIVKDFLRPESRIIGAENILDLHRLSQEGKSCLILMEHYSNFDIPAFYLLLKKLGEQGKAASDAIIAIAGLKLNAESRVVLAFTEAYSRIVIYPSRYHDAITDPEQLKEERKRSNIINRAALHQMIRCKHSGNMILVFPSGTRYRPGVPETKRGLKEIDSYIRAFDHVVFIGIGGNILRINPSREMEEDILCQDTVMFKISPVMACEDFRAAVRNEAPPEMDQKQFVADRVMEELEKLHEDIEKIREPKTP
jgi:glycerol-3-phosphate O-acyltransferase